MLFSNCSFSGAWLQPKGDVELIFETEQKDLFSYYKNPYNSNTTTTNIYSFLYYSIFSRYGITKDLNIGIEANWYDYKTNFNDGLSIADNSILLKNTEKTDPYSREFELYLDSHYKKYENKLSEYKFFSQLSLWSDDFSVISVKPSVGGFLSNKINMFGISVLYGKGFDLFSKHAFIDFEAGVDNIYNSPLINSNSLDSLKIILDLSLGIDFTETQSFMIQSFNHTNPTQYLKESLVKNSNSEFSNILKISWVYSFNKHLFWQNGYSTNITKRDQYIVNSIITSLGVKF